MGEKTKVEKVVSRLRWGIMAGQFAKEPWLPKETDMAEGLKVSRATLRAALTFLKAEGFVESVPGIRWRATTTLDAVSFEALTRMFEDVDGNQRPELIQALLEHRTQLVVGAVATLVRERQVIREYVRARVMKLEACADEEVLTIKVLELEDDFFTALIENGRAVPKQLAAHQLGRAFAAVRFWLNPNCRSRTISSTLRSLVDAIDAHEPRALELAFEAASARVPLYRQLVARRLARCQVGNSDQNRAVG